MHQLIIPQPEYELESIAKEMEVIQNSKKD